MLLVVREAFRRRLASFVGEHNSKRASQRRAVGGLRCHRFYRQSAGRHESDTEWREEGIDKKGDTRDVAPSRGRPSRRMPPGSSVLRQCFSNFLLQEYFARISIVSCSVNPAQRLSCLSRTFMPAGLESVTRCDTRIQVTPHVRCARKQHQNRSAHPMRAVNDQYGIEPWKDSRRLV